MDQIKLLIDPGMESKFTNKEPEQIEKVKRFLKELKEFPVSNNCQKFACALELKFRGKSMDVTETTSPVSKVFDIPVGRKDDWYNWCLFKNKKWTKIDPRDSFKSVQNTMKEWGSGARAIIAVAWKEGRGHVFNLINIKGEIYLMDATHERFKPISGSPYVKEYIDAKRSPGLIRSDDGSPDKQMIEDTFSENEKEFNLDEEEPKYISVTAALSSKGEEDKSYTVYRNKKKIGKIICGKLTHTYGDDYKIYHYSWE